MRGIRISRRGVRLLDQIIGLSPEERVHEAGAEFFNKALVSEKKDTVAKAQAIAD